MAFDLHARLTELNMQLPDYTPPMGSYEPWVEAGGQLVLSGHVSILPGVEYCGRLGDTLSVEEGKRAAQTCVLGLLSRMNAALESSWESFAGLVRLNVFVASSAEFSALPDVANGASELLVAVLGKAGRHARTAVGVAALPRRAAVEIDLIAQLHPRVSGSR